MFNPEYLIGQSRELEDKASTTQTRGNIGPEEDGSRIDANSEVSF